MALGKPADTEALVTHILHALDRLCAEYPARQAQWLERYRRDCLTVGREVMLMRSGAAERAFAEGIGEDFGLAVRYPDGRRETITWGEVSVRGLLGYI
jgi:BirA family biotin operon repressor/biotin-[acetyl-CoA-carboxylase] ligase